VAIGVDRGSPLAKSPARWNQFLAAWGHVPTYAGRYFGTTSHKWVPGELFALPAASQLSLRYIFPIAPTGPISTTRRTTLVGHGIAPPGHPDQIVLYEQQGESDSGKPLRATRVREIAQTAALATCEAIAAALSFVDPHTGKHELALPNSDAVFVFLNVEPQTTLHPDYWLGWAETISGFVIWKTTALGTVMPVQPLRPCLYCGCDNSGPFTPEITNAFLDMGLVPRWIRGRHPCYALFTGWRSIHPLKTAIAADEADVQSRWTASKFGTLQQPNGPAVPVVIWQYRINLGMDAAGVLKNVEDFPFDAKGNSTVVFDIDLSATSSVAYEGRPVTDYMLVRP
jgi:hypothetical protein